MGLLWGRRKVAQFKTGHAGDDQLLTLLARASDITEPRHWVHFLYFANETAARGAAEVVAGAGWQVARVSEALGGGPHWAVVAEKYETVTSPEAVRDARRFFETVADHWDGGDYDGWEASA